MDLEMFPEFAEALNACNDAKCKKWSLCYSSSDLKNSPEVHRLIASLVSAAGNDLEVKAALAKKVVSSDSLSERLLNALFSSEEFTRGLWLEDVIDERVCKRCENCKDQYRGGVIISNFMITVWMAVKTGFRILDPDAMLGNPCVCLLRLTMYSYYNSKYKDILGRMVTLVNDKAGFCNRVLSLAACFNPDVFNEFLVTTRELGAPVDAREIINTCAELSRTNWTFGQGIIRAMDAFGAQCTAADLQRVMRLSWPIMCKGLQMGVQVPASDFFRTQRISGHRPDRTEVGPDITEDCMASYFRGKSLVADQGFARLREFKRPGQ